MSTHWEFLVTLNERLRPLKDPVAIQEVTVGLLAAHLHASRVHYAHIDGHCGRRVAVPGSRSCQPLRRSGRLGMPQS
jgi:hypothetical protein